MNAYLKDLMAFADLMAACNVIDEDAVCFSDEYDGGITLGRIAEAHRRLKEEQPPVAPVKPCSAFIALMASIDRIKERARQYAEEDEEEENFEAAEKQRKVEGSLNEILRIGKVLEANLTTLPAGV